jgi:hypothetical protein
MRVKQTQRTPHPTFADAKGTFSRKERSIFSFVAFFRCQFKGLSGGAT